MRDARTEIVQSWITAIATAIPGRAVYTIVPKPTDNSGTLPPDKYVHISDIYQEETGPKNEFYYSYDVLLQVVYNGITSKIDLWSDANAILGVIENERDFTLGNDFDLMQMTLISNSEEEILTDSGRKNIQLIRVRMDIEDNA